MQRGDPGRYMKDKTRRSTFTGEVNPVALLDPVNMLILGSPETTEKQTSDWPTGERLLLSCVLEHDVLGARSWRETTLAL